MGHTLSSSNSGGKATNNNNEGPMQQQQVPSTPQIRTSKELEMSLLHHGRVGGGSHAGGAKGVNSPYAPTILYSHANAEDLGNIYPWCKFLSKMLGVNIFAYDYTGYGLATDQGEFLFVCTDAVVVLGEGCPLFGIHDFARSSSVHFSNTPSCPSIAINR